MKRTIALITAILLCFGLCACGNKESTAPAATEAPAETPVAEAATEAPTEAPEPFVGLPEHYTLQTPTYTLASFYSSLGDDTYTYSNFIYDLEGRIIGWDKQENKHAAQSYTCTYDENDNLATVTYHHPLYGYTETYTYNELGQMISLYETDPEDAEYYLERTYTYDDNGMPASDRTSSSSDFYDGGGSDMAYEYDTLGRVIAYSDCSVDDYNHFYEIVYNDAGQVLKETSRTVDEGTHKYTYETTYQYNVYGFPVVADVDNSFDYKGDTTKWQSRSEYAVTAYREVSSEQDATLNPTSQWVSFAEAVMLPTPDSIMPALAAQMPDGFTYQYLIPTTSSVIPSTNPFGLMQGLDDFGRIDLRAYSTQAEANEVLWRYTAALTQVLGLEIAEFEDKLVVMDGSFTLATLTIEHKNGNYLLTVSINGNANAATESVQANATASAEDPLLEVEALLQGSWEYYDSSIGYGEVLTFDHGVVSYLSYLDSARDKDHTSSGTYRVTEDNVITTMNGYDAYFDYEIKGQQLSLTWYIDSGADKGNTRVFSQIEKGELDPNYRPSQKEAPVSSVAPAATPAATAAPSKSSSSSTSSGATMGERNALEDAKLYLQVMAFSYEGLIDQLEYEGYTYSEAKYGADHCGADWFEQAALCAAQYLDVMPFSRSELIDQLEYEGFTYAQAEYGVEQNGY